MFYFQSLTKHAYLTILPWAGIGYNHLISNKREWNSCFIKYHQQILLDFADFAWLEQPECNLMDAISRVWYNGSYTIVVKPIKMLELHYTMIQLLIIPFILNPLDVLRSYEARVRILEEEVKSMEEDKLKSDMERNTAYKEVSKLLWTERGLMYSIFLQWFAVESTVQLILIQLGCCNWFISWNKQLKLMKETLVGITCWSSRQGQIVENSSQGKLVDHVYLALDLANL